MHAKKSMCSGMGLSDVPPDLKSVTQPLNHLSLFNHQPKIEILYGIIKRLVSEFIVNVSV